MRMWGFGRISGIASEPFRINQDGLQFVSTILGFLCMSEEELGFDPTTITAEGGGILISNGMAGRSVSSLTNW